MATVGSFTLIKNEARWIAAHLHSWLPVLDEMVFFDGDSTDGTLEIIRAIHQDHKHGDKIRLFTSRDPEDLGLQYERMSDECMRQLTTDYAAFIHPDMILRNPEAIKRVRMSDAVALSMGVRSFAGEPDGKLFEIRGRGEKWKNIYRLRNPDLGAHYHGKYGDWNEDVYFSEITGNSYDFHGNDFHKYPYTVENSGLQVWHFSDVRPLSRRISRMVKCLVHNDWPEKEAFIHSTKHPRVTLQDGDGMTFSPAEYPKDFIEAREVYSHLEKKEVLA